VSTKYVEKFMLKLGLQYMQFSSEEYSHHSLTRSATSGSNKEPSSRNIHPWKQN